MVRNPISLCFGILLLSACSGGERPGTSPAISAVTATAETAPVGTGQADAADDPAIWHNRENPSESLVVATDKKAGLYVYGLNGEIRDFQPDGRLNNVDLVELPDGRVLVAASDRSIVNAARIRLYYLAKVNSKLIPLGVVPVAEGEAYGICLSQTEQGTNAFSVLKDGRIVQQRIELQGLPSATLVKTFKVSTQAEGCVADDRTSSLYVGEEDVGIWRFDLGQPSGAAGTLVAKADGKHLVADVEGLALAPEGVNGGWLVASSQGDNSYAVFQLPDMKPSGKFRIAAGTFGSTEETDGIALMPGDFGPDFPGGLFIAQDGQNAPVAQNFKLASWAAILRAMGQKGETQK